MSIVRSAGDSALPVVSDTLTADTAAAVVAMPLMSDDSVVPAVAAVPVVAEAEEIAPDSVVADSLALDSLGGPRSVIQRHSASLSDSARRPVLARTRLKAFGNDTTKIVRTKVDLDNSVDFSAADSMVLRGRNMAYMYGDSKVTYGTIKLDAANIEMNLDSSTVYAQGVPDSLGVLQGTPVFDDNGTSYEAKTMRYNFQSEKGFLVNVITQQGEGYITGGRSKKVDENTVYIEDAIYTTCDDHEHPHFWMQLTKTKVRPGKDAVTGPAYMVLAGLPLPLAVPFGYFPFSKKYSSGIIFPTFGDDYNRGYYLSNGGYYLALSENMDLALTGELYTLGSWGVRAQSAYLKRYKYSGSFNLSYLKTVTGDKGMPDYATSTNFQILWSHSQDTKANPNMNLSASVNFTTSGYTRNDLGSYYSSAFTENTKSSTINLTYRFPNSK
ncbi:MAG: hypothetical protein K2K72_04390, partial [Duncaniella sp.]|nr:hypothetical protein [Duncaniella sp.]